MDKNTDYIEHLIRNEQKQKRITVVVAICFCLFAITILCLALYISNQRRQIKAAADRQAFLKDSLGQIITTLERNSKPVEEPVALNTAAAQDYSLAMKPSNSLEDLGDWSAPPPPIPPVTKSAKPAGVPAKKYTVYIQFKNEYASQTKSLTTALQGRFMVPEAEPMNDQNFNPSVRYFHPEDEDTARKIAAIAHDLTGLDYQLTPVKLAAPKRQIEVWVGMYKKDAYQQ